MTQLIAKLSTEGKIEIVPLVGDTLKLLQDAVGGYVEISTLADDLVMWFNEEGKIKRLPFNQAATSIYVKFKGGSDYIVGNVVFTGGSDDEGVTQGLSEQVLATLQAYAALSSVV